MMKNPMLRRKGLVLSEKWELFRNKEMDIKERESLFVASGRVKQEEKLDALVALFFEKTYFPSSLDQRC